MASDSFGTITSLNEEVTDIPINKIQGMPAII